MKQFHKEPQFMNTEQNKIKRRDFLVRLEQLQADGNSIIYMDETNFNLWPSRTRSRSICSRRAVKKVLAGGSQNLQVIACVGKGGVIHYETKLGSNKYHHSNDFIRNTLRKFADVSKVVVVLDNAQCHARAEAVFEEPEFAAATLLRLGPYSPMLNPIENVFSTFKSAVKDFMTEHRAEILSVPPGTTMKAHRQRFLIEAAETLFPRVATAQLCASCYRHTLRFPVKVAALEDMPVGR
ncbi:Replication protein A 70 kDa DNA-binding subunit [Phytophthora cinnamomi]|uniref:Replication protein A 70 kDa DNA-binding subunit n=1 Tax=Phytophthora cinnamomi TaxID=4785 RepID=UPI00355A3442|nr:Replication protein A 70 kDa DNA-binding subunit [Phytophthora cinnamomi]